MSNGIQHCPSHDELTRIAGRSLQVAEEHGRQLSTIFEKLDDIKTTVDQNFIRARQRDLALVDLKASVIAIDEKIENGLKAEIAAAAENVRQMKACIEKRRTDREINAKKGFQGFITVGWEKFREHTSFLFVAGMFALLVWFIFMIIDRQFQEGFVQFLRFWGIGK